MLRRDLVILNKLGLHARAAAKFVKCAGEYRADIHVSKDSLRVNGKSIMGVLLLAAPQGCTIEIIVDGPDEQDAAAAIEALVASHFGEE